MKNRGGAVRVLYPPCSTVTRSQDFPSRSLIHPVNPSRSFCFFAPNAKEVKEAAISGMATCIASFADSLPAEVPKVSACLTGTA